MWFWLLYAAGIMPLSAAWWANRRTTLMHALAWTLAAWAAWGWAAFAPSAVRVYSALGLTACAGVSVLGARRPGAGAWHFVVVSLAIVLGLVVVESAFLGTPLHAGTFRTWFLATLLGAIVLNYLPTRLWSGALPLAFGCVLALWWLTAGSEGGYIHAAYLFVWLAPWLAWAGLAGQQPTGSDADRHWRAFRDRYGAIWGLRLREQFNRSAVNAGWPLELGWLGMREVGAMSPTVEQRTAAHAALAALTKRFGSF